MSKLQPFQSVSVCIAGPIPSRLPLKTCSSWSIHWTQTRFVVAARGSGHCGRGCDPGRVGSHCTVVHSCRSAGHCVWRAASLEVSGQSLCYVTKSCQQSECCCWLQAAPHIWGTHCHVAFIVLRTAAWNSAGLCFSCGLAGWIADNDGAYKSFLYGIAHQHFNYTCIAAGSIPFMVCCRVLASCLRPL